MREWKIEVSPEVVKKLEDSIVEGLMLDDDGMCLLNEKVVERIDGLKIEIFSNEHPPPHFRVCLAGLSNNFSISECQPLNGNALSKYFKNIKAWHRENKAALIDAWDNSRPSDCPVGKYMEECDGV